MLKAEFSPLTWDDQSSTNPLKADSQPKVIYHTNPRPSDVFNYSLGEWAITTLIPTFETTHGNEIVGVSQWISGCWQWPVTRRLKIWKLPVLVRFTAIFTFPPSFLTMCSFKHCLSFVSPWYIDHLKYLNPHCQGNRTHPPTIACRGYIQLDMGTTVYLHM